LVATFLLAYVLVSALGFGLYLIISRVRVTSPWDEVEVHANRSYQIAQRFLPLINLIVWTLCAWLYFAWTRAEDSVAVWIALAWLIAAVIIDFIVFVAIKTPLSVDRKSFYIGQFPWIYLTYIAVFVAPFLVLFIEGLSG
jgi:hypothetical protein